MDGFLRTILPLALGNLLWATPEVTIQKGYGGLYTQESEFSPEAGHTIQDELESTPGTFFKQLGGLGSSATLTLRGLGAHHTLVTLDGVPIRDALNTTDLSPFLGNSTQLESLVQGSSGVLHGPGATGGVLALKTPHHIKNQYTIMGGSHQTGYVHTAFTKNTPSTHLTLHTDAMNTAGLPRRGVIKYGQNTHNQRGSVAGNFTHVSQANTYNMTFRRAAGYSQYSPNLTTPKPQNKQSQNLSFFQSNVQHHTLNAHHFMQGFYMASTLKGTASPGNRLASKGFNYNYHYQTKKWFFRSLTGVSWHGFQKAETNKKDIPQGHVGVLMGYHFKDHLMGEVGVRLNHQKPFGSIWTYTTGLCWDNHNTQIASHFQTAFLNPSLFDLYVNNQFTKANPGLKPETSRTIDLSIKHALQKNLWVTAKPYVSRFHNMMKTNFLPQNQFQKQNIGGNSYVSGIETGFIHQLTNQFGYTLTYSHTRYNLNAPNTNTEFPENKLSFKGIYNPTNDTKFTIINHAIGKRRSQNHNLRAYNVMHLRASYAVEKNVNIFARIENLFNTRYETIHNFQTEGQSFYVGIHIQH